LHVLAEHWVPATWSAAPPQSVLQLLPHTPQFASSLLVLVLQLVPSPGQLVKGGLQLPTPHVQSPPTKLQAGVPLVVVHTLPQAPQLLMVLSGVEQFVPSPGQSPQPLAQLATPHVPPVQSGVPLVVVQTWLQAPQLFTSDPPMYVRQLVPLPGQDA